MVDDTRALFLEFDMTFSGRREDGTLDTSDYWFHEPDLAVLHQSL